MVKKGVVQQGLYELSIIKHKHKIIYMFMFNNRWKNEIQRL
jgi:hypothetical protein